MCFFLPDHFRIHSLKTKAKQNNNKNVNEYKHPYIHNTKYTYLHSVFNVQFVHFYIINMYMSLKMENTLDYAFLLA